MRETIRRLRLWETVWLVAYMDTACNIGISAGFAFGSSGDRAPILSTQVVGYIISLIGSYEQRRTAPRAFLWTSVGWAVLGIVSWVAEAIRLFAGIDLGVLVLPGALLAVLDWIMFRQDPTLRRGGAAGPPRAGEATPP